MISDAGLASVKTFKTPLEQNQELTSREYDDLFSLNSSDTLMSDPTSFRRIIGRLLYLTMSRLGIACSAQHLSQFMQSPKVSHMEAAKRIIWYIKDKSGMGLLFLAKHDYQLVAFCDSDWGTYCMSRRFMFGYCVKL